MGLEGGVLARLDLFDFQLHKRDDPRVQVLLSAVVSVKGDRNRVVLRNLTRVSGHRQGSRDAVLDGRSGPVFGAADRNLDDTVGLRLSESLQGCRQGLGRGDIYRGVRKATLLRAVEHFKVDLWCCDWHKYLLVFGEPRLLLPVCALNHCPTVHKAVPACSRRTLRG